MTVTAAIGFFFFFPFLNFLRFSEAELGIGELLWGMGNLVHQTKPALGVVHLVALRSGHLHL